VISLIAKHRGFITKNSLCPPPPIPDFLGAII